jgi:hypothetical protein
VTALAAEGRRCCFGAVGVARLPSGANARRLVAEARRLRHRPLSPNLVAKRRFAPPSNPRPSRIARRRSPAAHPPRASAAARPSEGERLQSAVWRGAEGFRVAGTHIETHHLRRTETSRSRAWPAPADRSHLSCASSPDCSAAKIRDRRNIDRNPSPPANRNIPVAGVARSYKS